MYFLNSGFWVICWSNSEPTKRKMEQLLGFTEIVRELSGGRVPEMDGICLEFLETLDVLGLLH